MSIRTRSVSVGVVLSILCAGLIGASLAWACAPTNWGWTAPTAPTPGQGAQSSPAPSSVPAPAGSQSSPVPHAQPSSPPSSSKPASAIASQRTSGQSSVQPATSPSRHRASSQPASQPSTSPSPRSTSPGTQQVTGPASAQSPARAPVALARNAGHVAAAQSRASSSRSAAPHASAGHRGPSSVVAPKEQQGGTGDLWSGYGSAKSPSLSPGTSGSSAEPAAPPSGQLPLGVILLALAAAGLLAGLTVAGVRRRRALAPFR